MIDSDNSYTNISIMPSYQVNDDTSTYGRAGSYNNYGYGGSNNDNTVMMKDRYDRPPAYNGRGKLLLLLLVLFIFRYSSITLLSRNLFPLLYMLPLHHCVRHSIAKQNNTFCDFFY